jgi:hypothetical protein
MNDKDKAQPDIHQKDHESWRRRNYKNIPEQDARLHDSELRAKEREARGRFWDAMLSWDPSGKDPSIPKVYINGVHLFHFIITLPILCLGLAFLAFAGMAVMRLIG